MRGLKDKVAIITGAAGGIGRGLVQRFLEEGARRRVGPNRQQTHKR